MDIQMMVLITDRERSVEQWEKLFSPTANELVTKYLEYLKENAGFCRNCLSKWYLAAAEERGVAMDYEKAREIIYGMPYAEWKDKFQK